MTTYYTVRKGDSPASVARAFGDERRFADILAANGGAAFKPGMRIVIPSFEGTAFVSNQTAASYGMATSGQIADAYADPTLKGRMPWTAEQGAANKNWAYNNSINNAPDLINGRIPTDWVGGANSKTAPATDSAWKSKFAGFAGTTKSLAFGGVLSGGGEWKSRIKGVTSPPPLGKSVGQKFREADVASMKGVTVPKSVALPAVSSSGYNWNKFDFANSAIGKAAEDFKQWQLNRMSVEELQRNSMIEQRNAENKIRDTKIIGDVGKFVGGIAGYKPGITFDAQGHAIANATPPPKAVPGTSAGGPTPEQAAGLAQFASNTDLFVNQMKSGTRPSVMSKDEASAVLEQLGFAGNRMADVGGANITGEQYLRDAGYTYVYDANGGNWIVGGEGSGLPELGASPTVGGSGYDTPANWNPGMYGLERNYNYYKENESTSYTGRSNANLNQLANGNLSFRMQTG